MADTTAAATGAPHNSATPADPNRKVWPQSPWVPFDDRAVLYSLEHWEFGGVAQAWEYTGWRDETLSWKTTAYVHGHLNPSPTARITGGDALRFLQGVCVNVNSFQKFQVGAGRHAVMTDDAGRVAAHGMLLRVAEQEFLGYWLSPYLNFRQLQRPDLDVQLEDLTGRVFLFQIGGPRSLEILEDAAGENLHDVAFLRTRMTRVAGEEVRIVRIGMAATLSYELHGPLEAAQKVFQADYDAGLPYGIRKLGVQAYMCNHTEGGFPQAYLRDVLSRTPASSGDGSGRRTLPSRQLGAYLQARPPGTEKLTHEFPSEAAENTGTRPGGGDRPEGHRAVPLRSGRTPARPSGSGPRRGPTGAGA